MTATTTSIYKFIVWKYTFLFIFHIIILTRTLQHPWEKCHVIQTATAPIDLYPITTLKASASVSAWNYGKTMADCGGVFYWIMEKKWPTSLMLCFFMTIYDLFRTRFLKFFPSTSASLDNTATVTTTVGNRSLKNLPIYRYLKCRS